MEMILLKSSCEFIVELVTDFVCCALCVKKSSLNDTQERRPIWICILLASYTNYLCAGKTLQESLGWWNQLECP